MQNSRRGHDPDDLASLGICLGRDVLCNLRRIIEPAFADLFFCVGLTAN